MTFIQSFSHLAVIRSFSSSSGMALLSKVLLISQIKVYKLNWLRYKNLKAAQASFEETTGRMLREK